MGFPAQKLLAWNTGRTFLARSDGCADLDIHTWWLCPDTSYLCQPSSLALSAGFGSLLATRMASQNLSLLVSWGLECANGRSRDVGVPRMAPRRGVLTTTTILQTHALFSNCANLPACSCGCAYVVRGQSVSIGITATSLCYFQVPNTMAPPSANMSMFLVPPEARPRIPERANIADAIITTNKGVYSNPPGGVVSELGPGGKGVHVPAGTYVLVPSTFKPHQQAEFEVSVWSTAEACDVDLVPG